MTMNADQMFKMYEEAREKVDREDLKYMLNEFKNQRDAALLQVNELRQEVDLAKSDAILREAHIEELKAAWNNADAERLVAQAELAARDRLNGVLKAVVEMVVNNKPLWKIQSAAVDALGEATRQSHSTCCLSCQQRKDCAVCHCHVAKPDEEQQPLKRICGLPAPVAPCQAILPCKLHGVS